MASHTMIRYSPSKNEGLLTPKSPQRGKQPSLQKSCLPYTIVIIPPKRATEVTEAGSPVKKLKGGDGRDLIPDAEFDVQLGQDDKNLQKGLALSKRIELSYPLVSNGRATTPPRQDFSDIVHLFPTTFDVSVSPPFLIIRVRQLPLKPWPFTVSGLPVQFTTIDYNEPFKKGMLAGGPKILPHLDLHRTINYTHGLLLQVTEAYRQLNIRINDIFWFGGFWQVSVPDDVDLKRLPYLAASCPVFYLKESETPHPIPAALRRKPPQGVEYDDTMYATSETALLRPGIMLSSSAQTTNRDGKVQETWKTTTSGIMVADTNGNLFITVATHGFEDDGLVYHPNPQNGKVIGRIVQSLPDTDISLLRLRPGLRYINETFGTTGDPRGIRLTGLSPCAPPHLEVFDPITMNNPFTGKCEGLTLAVGYRISDDPRAKYVAHRWAIFENGNEPIDGSCGCPILDAGGRVIGLFRYKVAESNMCLCLSSTELREFGYEICGGEQIFT